MGRNASVATAAVGMVLILAGVLSSAWWVADVGGILGATLEVGLQKMCIADACVDLDVRKLTPGKAGFFDACVGLLYYGGILSVIALAIGVFLREYHDNNLIAGKAAFACALLFPLTVVTAFSFPGGAGVEVSYGWAFYSTLVGSLVAAVGGLGRSVSSGWENRNYVPVKRPPGAEIPTMPSAAPAPTAPAPAPAEMDADRLRHQYQEKVKQAVAPQRAAAQRSRSRRAGPKGAGSTTGTAVDAVRTSLRFVARSCEISDAGLAVVFESGDRRDLLWPDIARIVARTMPPDPPFEKTMLVDVVPGSPPATPIRLLSSTHVNYGALPGGAGVSSKENLRKLAALIIAHKPGVIEPESEGFFLRGQAAPQFHALKQFANYDAQYV